MPPAKRSTSRTAVEKHSGDHEEFQQVIVRMPVGMHEAIKERANLEERTMAQTIRRAVRSYLGEAVA